MKIISPKRLLTNVFHTIRNGDIFANSSLDLPFARTKTLDPRITFTRASSGTFVGSDGLIKSAVTNLVLRSEEFNDAAWTKTSATVTANAATAPNGTLTADKLITDSGATGGRVSVSITLVVGSPTTLSCYAKQGETSVFGLFVSDGVTGRSVDFDLITGTVSVAPTAGMTASIDPVGNGWYRCVATVASPSGTSGSIRIRQVVTANNGTDGILIWGAQLEQASTAGDYVPTTSTINSASRFDHNPTTGESLGLLVEEARTNLLLQSNQFDTTWTNSNTSETAASGTAPDGTNTAWEIKDTLDVISTAHSLVQSTSYTSGVAYTVSCWMKAGTVTEGGVVFPASAFTTAINCRINLTTGAVISSSSAVTASTVPYANGWYRVIATATATATSAGSINIRLANGALSYIGTGTGTILIWDAQIEAGAFPTSYIPTTTATVTRAADVASITGSNFSSFYNQTEGTFFVDSSQASLTPSSRMVSASDNTSSNRIILTRASALSGNISLTVTNAGTAQVAGIILGSGLAAGTSNKVATVYKAIDFAGSVNGLAAVTQGTGTVPGSLTQLAIGNGDILGANTMTGTIKRLTYWPTRLANTTLQQITQP